MNKQTQDKWLKEIRKRMDKQEYWFIDFFASMIAIVYFISLISIINNLIVLSFQMRTLYLALFLVALFFDYGLLLDSIKNTYLLPIAYLIVYYKPEWVDKYAKK